MYGLADAGRLGSNALFTRSQVFDKGICADQVAGFRLTGLGSPYYHAENHDDV